MATPSSGYHEFRCIRAYTANQPGSVSLSGNTGFAQKEPRTNPGIAAHSHQTSQTPSHLETQQTLATDATYPTRTNARTAPNPNPNPTPTPTLGTLGHDKRVSRSAALPRRTRQRYQARSETTAKTRTRTSTDSKTEIRVGVEDVETRTAIRMSQERQQTVFSCLDAAHPTPSGWRQP